MYLILEYCESDLFDSIVTGVYEEHKALRLFAQLATSIQYCHDNGIYHRDLKPENILVTSEINPHVRLSDFGLSTSDKYSSEFGCGSVRYMSPECLANNDITEEFYNCQSNDVWSLAIILINMLTGKNPWVEPCNTDKHFKSHLLSKNRRIDSFQKLFKFSIPFCKVLRSVFEPSQDHRPSAKDFLFDVLSVPCIFQGNELQIKKAPVIIESFSPSSYNCNNENRMTFGKVHSLPPTPCSSYSVFDENILQEDSNEKTEFHSSISEPHLMFDFEHDYPIELS